MSRRYNTCTNAEALLSLHMSRCARCDKLVNLLNDFGLDPELEADRALEVHNKVFPLLSSLRGLHGSQGLGFVSMGTVIDRKTLNRSFVAIVSVSSVVIPIIVALQPESVLVDQAGSS